MNVVMKLQVPKNAGNVACFLPGRAMELSAPLYFVRITKFVPRKIFLLCKSKGKGKVHPRTGHEGPEGEQMYSYTLSLTSAPNGVGISPLYKDICWTLDSTNRKKTNLVGGIYDQIFWN